MKKSIAILFAALLALSAAGCSTNSAPAPAETKAPETETAAPETTEAAETEAPETEDPEEETKAPSTETTKKILAEYGTYEFNGKQCSNLTFTFFTETLEDMGDYYTMEAEFGKPVKVSADLNEGDEITFIVNELTDEKVTAVLTDGELVNVNEEYDTYYYFPQEGQTEYVLTQFSDDVVSCPFYVGTVCIRKDATFGIAIMDDYHPLTMEDLENDPWMNAVVFDKDGMITDLMFIGD